MTFEEWFSTVGVRVTEGEKLCMRMGWNGALQSVVQMCSAKATKTPPPKRTNVVGLRPDRTLDPR